MDTSKEARARRDYFKEWNQKHPESVRAYNRRKWENKAKSLHGNAYEPPANDGELSEQARQIRNDYYKEYRRTHPENVKRTIKNFWSRKACQKGGTNAT